jgi:hypothetical protein
MHNGTNHFLSTFRGQASILTRVHSVLGESLRFGAISVPGSDRMDNLPKVHSYLLRPPCDSVKTTLGAAPRLAFCKASGSFLFIPLYGSQASPL